MAGAAGASLASNAKRFLTKWPSSARVYLPDGKVPQPGSVLKNPALANFFKRVLDAESSAKNRGREAGLDAARERFYRGDIAREIVAWSDANGGLLGAADLERFTTRIETPARADYRGVTVFKCGPWSQGPVFLQQLKLLEGFDLAAMGHNSADYIHTVIEAAKLAFADREAYYGDPEFIDVPLDGLLSDRYAAIRRELIDSAHASMDQRPGDPIAMRQLRDAPAADARPWGAGTIHVTAADRAGNMIAVTASGGWIPSSPVIDALGFPLGTRMQTFYLDEHHPNALMPGKRPRTTLSPSLAMVDGRAAPGIRHARRRSAGSMDAAIFPERRRLRDGPAGRDRGAQILDAAFPLDLLPAQQSPRRPAYRGSRACECARRARRRAATKSKSARHGPKATSWRCKSTTKPASSPAAPIRAARRFRRCPRK